MPNPDFEHQVLSTLATLTQKVDALTAGQRRLEEGQEEIKAHLTMQDAYLRQSFDRITDMLGHEDRIAELERKVGALMGR